MPTDRSATPTNQRRQILLVVSVVIVWFGAIASSAISIAALRSFRTLPSPPDSSRAERLQVLDDIKHGRVSDNVPLERAYAARLAVGTQRVATLVAGIVLISGVVVVLPGTAQTLALLLLVLVVAVVLAVSIPQTRQAKLMLTRLPPGGPADPAYQAKLQRQVKALWRWVGLVFLVIAAGVLVTALVGGMPIGIATGVWIGLGLLWVIGYFHSSWMARPR